jgi:uncharacterized membrane protein
LTRRGWFQLVLVVLLGLSVITNFFLLGVVARGGGEAPGLRFVVNQLAGAYPPEVRTEFRRVMREERAKTFAALRELRAARGRMTEAANTTPYDEKAVEEAMKGVREATSNLQELIQEYLLTALRNVRGKEGQ